VDSPPSSVSVGRFRTRQTTRSESITEAGRKGERKQTRTRFSAVPGSPRRTDLEERTRSPVPCQQLTTRLSQFRFFVCAWKVRFESLQGPQDSHPPPGSVGAAVRFCVLWLSLLRCGGAVWTFPRPQLRNPLWTCSRSCQRVSSAVSPVPGHFHLRKDWDFRTGKDTEPACE